MKFDDVILKRRSIRKYKSDDISDDLVISIIKSAIYCPSAHNRQPWKVIILKDELKDKVAEALLEKNKVLNDLSIPVTAGVIKNAPVLLVVFLDNSDVSKRDNDLLSLGAFIYNICLKATDLDLGSLWIANTSRIKEEISLITGVQLECVSTVAIGLSDQNPKLRPRKSINEVLIKNS